MANSGDFCMWQSGYEQTKYEINKMQTRYNILKDVLNRGGAGAQEVVDGSVGKYLRDHPEASRAEIAVKYGIVKAFRDGDFNSLEMLGQLYRLSGCIERFETTLPHDMINDRKNFFKAAGMAPRAALIRLIGASPVLEAASHFFVPGGIWPYDLIEAARIVEQGLYFELAAHKVFEEGSTYASHGLLFSLAVVVSAAFSLVRSEIAKGESTFVGWDPFVLLAHNLIGKYTLYDAYKAFMMNGWAPFPSTLVPGETHYTLAKQYYESFMDPKYNMTPKDARANAIYKVVFCYKAHAGTRPLYSSFDWGVSPDHLKALFTMMASWMKERDRVAMEPEYARLGCDAFHYSDDPFDEMTSAEAMEFAEGFLVADLDDQLGYPPLSPTLL